MTKSVTFWRRSDITMTSLLSLSVTSNWYKADIKVTNFLTRDTALADTYIARQKARTIAIQVILILCFSISISIRTRKLLHQYTGTVEGLCRVLLKATSQTIFILPNSPGFYNFKTFLRRSRFCPALGIILAFPFSLLLPFALTLSPYVRAKRDIPTCEILHFMCSDRVRVFAVRRNN